MDPAESRSSSHHGRMLRIGVAVAVCIAVAAAIAVGLSLSSDAVLTVTVVDLRVSPPATDRGLGPRVKFTLDEADHRTHTSASLLRLPNEEIAAGSATSTVARNLLLGPKSWFVTATGQTGGEYETTDANSVEFLVKKGASHELCYGDELVVARFEVERVGERQMAEAVLRILPEAANP